MFENLNWWEFLALLMIALLIFGDKLPKVIGDGLRMLRKLRMMAQNATTDLSKELGTDLQLADLHPKAFVRKHLLSEDEEEALRKPLRGLYDDLHTDIKGVRTDLKEVVDNIGTTTRPSLSGASAVSSSAVSSSAASSTPPASPVAPTPQVATPTAPAAAPAPAPTPAFKPVHQVEAARSGAADTSDVDVT